MKTYKSILLLILLLLACEKDCEPKGVCMACCEIPGKKVCHEMTKRQCEEYAKTKKDGLEWTFVEGSEKCLPIVPDLPGPG